MSSDFGHGLLFVIIATVLGTCLTFWVIGNHEARVAVVVMCGIVSTVFLSSAATFLFTRNK